MLTPDPFNYSHLLVRTDPTCHGANTTQRIAIRLDTEALMAGSIENTLPVIAGIWAEVTPDPDTAAQMLAILTGFADWAAPQGVTHWDQVTTATVHDFIAPGNTQSRRQLRKNTMHAAIVALADAGLYADPSPALELAAAPPQPTPLKAEAGKTPRTTNKYATCGGPRPTTNDEVLLIRLATRLAANSRTTHLCAAAVALASTSATTCEAPQVRWKDVHLPQDDPDSRAVNLPGRPTKTPTESTITPRSNHLGFWEYQVLADWKAECSANGAPSATASVLYTGRQPLIGNSAQVSADRQVRKAIDLADLSSDPTLTAGSLRLWAAARHVTGWDALPQAAQILGVEPHTLNRWLRQLGDQDR